MASGLGKRFGGNKLMVDFAGKPMVQWILEATEDLFDARVVVTRHMDVAQLARDMGLQVVLHDLPDRNDTVRLGVEAMEGMEACLFCPGDQPLLRRESIIALLQAAQAEKEYIWRAAHGETEGIPVLFPKRCFEELRNLPRGKGGGYLAKQNPEDVRFVQVQDAWELKDADTPEDLTALLAQLAYGRN